ncbi:unnamed protein product [Phytophthora fragariaefolia]|uniref:Unnamed protein product n=1 Tax=Phytophthora fragariaefolia TaxID=1490495 RepID=A0A9W7D091_9STRA|nr:unnamed protein product [Phytophthora fragariaefolia]
MARLEAARRSAWGVVYAAGGLCVLLKLLVDAYASARDVCELYPHFSFGETLREELALHHTTLPLVRAHVPTLQLLGGYAALYAAKLLGLLDRGWPLLLDVLSGRWLYRQLVEVLPSLYVTAPTCAWGGGVDTCSRAGCRLPFGLAEPDVPELLSEDEGRAALEDDDELDDAPPTPPMDHEACSEALAKLVQVKMLHANRTIARPDDWLVFDPVQDKLVLQKHATRRNGGVPNGHCSGQEALADKVSLPRRQEPIGDSEPSAAEPRPSGADGGAEQAPREERTGIRKRL